MTSLDISDIPENHIMKRWTIIARDILPGDLVIYQKDHALPAHNTFLLENVVEKNRRTVTQEQYEDA